MILDKIQRFRHSRGYGVHSPFAFNFITNVVYEKHWYYAFTDIEFLLLREGIDLLDFSFHHLSYRLIRYLAPRSILEIGFNSVANILFVCHPYKSIRCYSYGKDESNVTLVTKLLDEIDREAIFVNNIDRKMLFDSIFVNLEEMESIDITKLYEISSNTSFWVLKGINSKEGKRLWKSIINDDRVSISFDKKNVGIAVLNNSYKKQNYLI